MREYPCGLKMLLTVIHPNGNSWLGHISLRDFNVMVSDTAQRFKALSFIKG